jgi:hypothetical protein
LTKLLATHAPHIVFVVAGVVAFFWTAYRKPSGGVRVGAAAAPAEPPARRPVAASAPLPVARRGLLALGPLLCALATGAILYGVNLGSAPVPGALIWVHSGVSVLALLLVGYKLAAMRRARIRRALTAKRLPELLSLVLGVISVPLLITGIQLLIAPSGGSFAAYAHLVSSAWWSGLLLWHLRRYVGPALRASLGRSPEEPARLPAG